MTDDGILFVVLLSFGVGILIGIGAAQTFVSPAEPTPNDTNEPYVECSVTNDTTICFASSDVNLTIHDGFNTTVVNGTISD